LNDVTSSSTPLLRRALTALGIVLGVAAATAPTVFAHTEFDVGEVAPGSIVDLKLFVENESSTAGTTQVELRFPEPLVIVGLPTVEGWTATPVEGSVGAEAIGVVWVRPTASPDEDPNLPLTIGPLPAAEGRLQFKVLQTYSDGTEDAWIEVWPVGAVEPDRPGPVLDLVVGAPGTIPAPGTIAPVATDAATTNEPADTAAGSITTVATTQPATPAVTSPAATTAPADADDDSSNSGVIIGIVIAVVVIAGAAAVVTRRRSRPN
jgi:uncharacterized protein DUF1775